MELSSLPVAVSVISRQGFWNAVYIEHAQSCRVAEQRVAVDSVLLQQGVNTAVIRQQRKLEIRPLNVSFISQHRGICYDWKTCNCHSVRVQATPREG